MKTTVVPAQITTVEDRIIGNLTFAQILILMIPLITGTISYVYLKPGLHLNFGKTIFIGAQFFFFGLMASRINGRILADWLVIFIRFSLRPKIYIFSKEVLDDAPELAMESAISKSADSTSISEARESSIKESISIKDQEKLELIEGNQNLSIRYKFGKKGGLHVSLKPIKN